jgi:hypothetical protein
MQVMTVVRRVVVSVGALLSFVLVLGLRAPAQESRTNGGTQKWSVPRTPWGHPNLQGVWTSDGVLGVPFEKRPAELSADEKAFEEKLRAIEEQVDPRGSNVIFNDRDFRKITPPPASLVVDPPDGRVPITAEMKSIVLDVERDVRRYGVGLRSYEDLDLWDRCITKGFPTVMQPIGQGNLFQIFQTPDTVAIHHEGIHDVRIIPLDGRPHIGPEVRQWWGDSRGRWEGDTLVVDITNFSDRTFAKQQQTGRFRGGSKDMQIVERWRLTDKDVLEYRATMTDPRSSTRHLGRWRFRSSAMSRIRSWSMRVTKGITG